MAKRAEVPRADAYIDKTDQCQRDVDIPEPMRRALLASGDQAAMEQTIMDLFYRSAFYDKQSNNEALRQQFITQQMYKEELNKMTGI